MKIGIVGLPNVGKSTLFNALTKSYAADAANFPFCTIEPNIGIVDVRDERLDTLARISQTKKIVYATTKFVDIAGLVKGASSGEGLGNKFLSHIREVDVIVQVLRHFADTDVSHVEGTVDPMRDVEIINTELIIADLELIDKNLAGMAKKASVTKDPLLTRTVSALTTVAQALRVGKLAYSVRDMLSPEEQEALSSYNLLTYKPFVYAINIAQDDMGRIDEIRDHYAPSFVGTPLVFVCAALECEMMTLTGSERQEFVDMIVEKEQLTAIPTLNDVIHAAYNALGLMYYFTTGEQETRAWSVPIGSSAPQAAGAIHTDFIKGFIKAEIVHYDDFVTLGSRVAAKEGGKMKLQGKEYIVQDGDVIIFKCNR